MRRHYKFCSQFTPVVVHSTIPCGHISRGLDRLIEQGDTVILPVFEGSLELHQDSDAYVGQAWPSDTKSAENALTESPTELERLRLRPRFVRDLRDTAFPMPKTLPKIDAVL